MLYRKVILLFVFISVAVASCSKFEIDDTNNLQNYITSISNTKYDAVIACASSDKNEISISHIYFYPEFGAKDYRYFEIGNALSNSLIFSQYKEKKLPINPLFNGYLQEFLRDNTNETWCIVTFEKEDSLHISNPILLKHKSKPTEFSNDIAIDFSNTLHPVFSWNDGIYMDNYLYFEVISDENNNLLSGTYTSEKWFQYYHTTNVVFNITQEIPPELISNNGYHFTLMAVSEDNWVNLLINKPFLIP